MTGLTDLTDRANEVPDDLPFPPIRLTDAHEPHGFQHRSFRCRTGAQ